MKDNSNTRPVGVLRRLSRPLPDGILDFLPQDALDPLEIDDLELEADPEADARLDREALFDARLISLTPAERVVYLALAPVLDADPRVQERIAGGGRLMLSLRLPSQDWLYSAQASFEAWLAGIHVESPELGQTVRVHTAKTDRFRAENIFDVRAVWREISIAHLLLVRGDDDELDETIQVALDADIDLTDIPFATFASVLRERFGDDAEIVEPANFSASRIDPGALNSACGRCNTASEIMPLVTALVAADHRKEAAAKRAREIEEKPKSTTSSRSVAPTQILRPTSPKVEDLYGYGAAAVWGLDLCVDLAAYASGDLGWQDVDAGCLLFGPPGTGKTLFASALAASSGLPFVATSYADWQSQGEGHSGYVVKALRQRFSDAIAAAPAILFIDEIDVVGSRGGHGDHDGWWRMIITALLESLDGTTRREGLVVIAACNDPNQLDPALIRSGRLDRRFEIGLPDETALARIFAHHLPGADETAFATAATVLAGSASGADVARIAREARRVARRQKRDLVAGDLLSIAMPEDTRPPEVQRLTAVHEAGHAVAAMSLGRMPEALSVIRDGSQFGGQVRFAGGVMRGFRASTKRWLSSLWRPERLKKSFLERRRLAQPPISNTPPMS